MLSNATSVGSSTVFLRTSSSRNARTAAESRSSAAPLSATRENRAGPRVSSPGCSKKLRKSMLPCWISS